jgi:hypothetical protein
MKFKARKPGSNWIPPHKIVERLWPFRDWDVVAIEDYPQTLLKCLRPVSVALEWVLDRVRPPQFRVKLDHWDTWSMDYTLAQIIHPMLIQLKDTKQGSPHVDDGDVPEHLKSTSAPPKENDWDTDANWHDRWTYVVDEMIWTFQQLKTQNHDEQFYTYDAVPESASFEQQLKSVHLDEVSYNAHYARIQNGTRLFGKYYQSLWD